MMPEEQSHAMESSAHGRVQRTGHIGGGIRFDFAERMLRAREDHRLAEFSQRVRQGRAGIAHRIGAVQHHERVGVIGMRAQIVDHRLPIIGRRIRRINQRIKFGERKQAGVHMRILKQTEQPSTGVGARNQTIRRVDHPDCATGVGDVNAHCLPPYRKIDAPGGRPVCSAAHFTVLSDIVSGYLPGVCVVSSTSATPLPLSSSISSIRSPLMRPRT